MRIETLGRAFEIAIRVVLVVVGLVLVVPTAYTVGTSLLAGEGGVLALVALPVVAIGSGFAYVGLTWGDRLEGASLGGDGTGPGAGGCSSFPKDDGYTDGSQGGE